MRPEIVQALAEGQLAGLSRTELAEKTGLKPRTVSRYRHQREVIEAVQQLRQRPRSEHARAVLVGLLGSESEQVRLNAALGLLRYTPKVEHEPPARQPAAASFVVHRDETGISLS